MNAVFSSRALIGVLVTLTLSVAAYFLGRSNGEFARQQQAASSAPTATPKERKALYWYDPMVPSRHFPQSGKSPFMDMQLVPKYGDETRGAESPEGETKQGGIAVDARVVQNLGVRVGTVELGHFARAIDAVGVVGVDEHRITVIQVRAPGWVEQLNVRAVGDEVHRGQLLVGVYSPDLLATQQELLLAHKAGESDLIAAARRRLALSGLSGAQIARVEHAGRAEPRVNYYAPNDGYVMALGVREGSAVQADTVLFQLADLRTVWLIAEVPEFQAGWIKPGDGVSVEAPAFPGQLCAGHVDYLYPELNLATRTLKVRVALANADLRLRPGMFVTTHLRGGVDQPTLMIPTEAVIKTGERSIVILRDDATHFRPVIVQIGAEQNGKSVVLAGLTQGQVVVASGQFLIDSEASMRGTLDNLVGNSEVAPPTATLMPAPSNAVPAMAH